MVYIKNWKINLFIKALLSYFVIKLCKKRKYLKAYIRDTISLKVILLVL